MYWVVHVFSICAQEIRPFIPVIDPVLSPAIYELVLHNLLQEDCQVFQYNDFYIISLYCM